QFALIGDKLAFCSKSGILSIASLGSQPQILDHCMNTWDWASRDQNFIVPIDRSHLGLYRGGAWHNIAFEPGTRPVNLSWSDTGLVAAVDLQGNGVVLTPGASSFQRLHFSGQPTGTSARGSTVAWSFADGTVKVRDTATNREWAIRAHIDGVICLHILP